MKKEAKQIKYYHCWSCETIVSSYMQTPTARIYCPDCRDEYESEKQKTLEEYLELKTRVAFERSMRMLEKQSANLYSYKDESEIVLELALKSPDKFGSSHEMVAAMELLRNRIKAKTQQKISKHRVDFYLEELKVILEIDGYMHDFSKLNDSKRDAALINELGVGWEVIRIPTKYIEKNVKQLVPAIKELHKYKQELRRKNNGFIPSYFSERDKMLHKDLF